MPKSNFATAVKIVKGMPAPPTRPAAPRGASP